MKVPVGVTLPPNTVPTDLQQAAPTPPAPTLTTFVVNKTIKFDGLASLKTPEKVLVAWGGHARFKTEFQEFLQQARLELPIDMPADKSTGTKREVDGNIPGIRKPKVEGSLPKTEVKDAAADTIVISSMPISLTSEADLTKSKASLCISVGERVCLITKTDSPVIIPRHHILAGFYKGK